MKGEYISTDTNVDFDSIIKKVESALDESPRYKTPKYIMKFLRFNDCSIMTDGVNKYLKEGWEYVDTRTEEHYSYIVILRKQI